ncbi:MAG: PD-(D/E)XK nuclease family protein, partial [Pseudomonadota bacterium]
KGVLYHRVMEDFVTHRLDVTASTAFNDHLQVAKYAFDAEELADDVMAVWLHRFSDALKPYLEWQAERVPTTRAIEVELFGRASNELVDFTLTGRLDRLDTLSDGTLALWDYKTGNGPSVKAVTQFKAPQLPLTIAMLTRDSFETNLEGAVGEAGYIRLQPGDKFKGDPVRLTDGTLEQLGDRAWQKLQRLILAYANADKPYLSKARPILDRDYRVDYDHLARVKEWALSQDDDDDFDGGSRD